MKNKTLVKPVSLLLIMLFAFMPFCTAYAAADEIGCYCPPEKPDFLSVEIPEGADTNADWDGVVAAIKSAVYCDTEQPEESNIEVDITSFGIPYTDENKECLKNYIYDSPELFVLRSNSYYSYYSPSNHIFTKLVFKGNPAENQRKYEECEDAIESLLFGIKGNSDLSDVDKCLILHDRLIAYCEYDYANYLSESIPKSSYNAYGVLVDRVAVCNGYVLAYMWLLNELGVENYYVSSTQISHAFLKVIIDSEPYYIDATWDDPVWDVPGRVSHNNFLLSFASFSANHDGATDYDSNVTSTLYEDYYSKNVNTQILYMNGYFYYLRDSVSDSTKYAIVRRDINGNEIEDLLIDKYYRVTIDGMTWRYTARPKLLGMGNEIIYTHAKDIRSYDIVTGEERIIYTPSSSFFPDEEYFIYGLKQVDGRIFLTANNSSNFDADTYADHTDSFIYCNHSHKEDIKPAQSDCQTLSPKTEICTDCLTVFHTTGYGPHNYVWTVTVTPDCQNEGEKKEICSVCGAEGEAQSIPVTAHTPGAAVRENETAAGCTEYGSYESVVYCTGCGIELSRTSNSISPTGHSLVYHSGRASTCSVKGYNPYYTCENCDYTTYSELPLEEHTPAPAIRENEIAATCSSQGSYESVVYCSACGVEISRTPQTTDPVAHSLVYHSGKASTCSVKGYNSYYTCENCDYTTYSELPLANHTPADAVTENEAAATCENGGSYDSVIYCSVCGEEISRETVNTEALGHSFTNYVYNNDATADSDGTETAKCNRCDATDTRTKPGTQLKPGEPNAVISTDKVVRGQTVTWTVMTPDDAVWLRFTNNYTTAAGTSGSQIISCKYDKTNVGSAVISVSEENGMRLWSVSMPLTYPGTSVSADLTFNIDYRRSGSKTWEPINSKDGEGNTVPFTQEVYVVKSADMLIPPTSNYEKYTIVSTAADKENGTFTIVTTDDVSKVRIKYTNAETGKVKSAAYQTTSSSLISCDTENGLTTWVVKYKFNASAENNTYSVQVRGSAWGEETRVICD